MPRVRVRWVVVSLVALFLVLAMAAMVSAAPVAGKDYVPGQVVVQFKPEVSAAAKEAVHASAGGSLLRTTRYGNLSIVRTRHGDDPERVAARYRQSGKVASAGLNFIYRANFVPDDPLFSQQWNLYNPVYGGINMPAAWDYTMGDPNVKVAVLDTGIAYENYDSDRNGLYDFLQAPDLTGTAFYQPFDFIDMESHANDDDEHGTHVCGTIAQVTNNSYGCAGIAPYVTVIPVKVLGPYGGTTETVANGIYYATQVGANVINMSLGSGYPDDVTRDACRFARGRGVLVVASAGNDGGPGLGYPAGYTECVLAVSATGYANEIASYSSYGPSLDYIFYGKTFGDPRNIIAAPGGNGSYSVIQQTITWRQDPFLGWVVDPLNFSFEGFQGTSMAAPHVSGVAALIMSMGITDPNAVQNILTGTATDLGSAGYDEQYGWGLLNAGAALQAAALSQYNAGPIAHAGINQVVTDVDGDGKEVVVLDGSGSTPSIGFPIVSYEWSENNVVLATGMSVSVNLTVGVHTIALTCRDSMGRVDTATATITVNPGQPILRVTDITISVIRVSGRKRVAAMVSIADAWGNPVAKAKVRGKWTGRVTKTPTAQSTNTLGVATISTGSYKTGTYTFTVTNVTKSGAIFRPDLSVTTSATASIY